MRWLIGFLLAFVLSGCSSKFAYNNLDWWVYWYLDDYIELNNKQEEQFDSYLQNWLRWHKTSELAKYQNHLEALKSQVINNELDYDVIYANLNKGKAHWERVRDEISPELAVLANELSDDQVIALFAALEKDNKEEEEERLAVLAKPEAKRLADRKERIEESIAERIGKLSNTQKQIIATYAEQFVSTSEDWLTYRREIQNAARRLFVTRTTNINFANELTQLMQNQDRFKSESYIQASGHNTKVTATMLAEIFTTMSEKQKATLVENIEELIEMVANFKGN
ncbi:DUF6279 family lipoprotein [Alteromonas sp. D210916BOD_24]|uniref:DUF6279 family lipoprotein n=1 Tax=Alteromonas sp. D210916BOD_24 TaxID=3157618 RepID=UPI00399D56D5